MNRRSKTARLLTGGLVGASTTPLPGDEHWNDVTLLLNAEANPLVDESPNSASNNLSVGTGVARNTSHKQFGSASIEFTSSGADEHDNIEVDIPTLDGDYTIEFWIKGKASDLSNGFVFDTRTANSTGISLFFPAAGTPNTNKLSYWNSSGTYRILSGVGAISTSSFDHVALVRSGAVVTLYLNGSSLGTDNEGTAISWPAATWTIGTRHAGTAGGWSGLNAYIDDFRVTKGFARYTANFTPPTASLLTNAPVVGRRGVGTYDTGDEHWDSVSLLIRGDTLTDLSGNAHTLNEYGSTPLYNDTTNTKFASGSLTFDGYDDYITSGGADLPVPADGGYTIECWIKLDLTAPEAGTVYVYGQSLNNKANGASVNTNKNGYYNYFWFDDLDTGDITTGANAVTLTDWHHLAFTFDGTTRTIWVNGISRASDTPTWSLTKNDNLMIGHQPASFTSGDRLSLGGNIEDFRITKGVARYTDTTNGFTPPTASLPTVLAGTPEATGTLRTRGYLGAAPAGFGGMLTLYDRYVLPVFNLTITAKGAGGGGQTLTPNNTHYGGNGGLSAATFSSTLFSTSFKVVVGSGGLVSALDNNGIGNRLKDMPLSGITYTNTGYSVSDGITTTHGGTSLYGLPGTCGARGAAGGGGGFTGVFSGTVIQHSDAVIIAGGGGGRGYSSGGGAGGGGDGANGAGSNPGSGATTSAGGGYAQTQNATYSAGAELRGGSPFGGDGGGGGGGGGGYYGGGAGWNGDSPTGNSGGGGGSGYIHASGTSTTSTQGGGSSGSYNVAGVDGELVISYPDTRTLTLSGPVGAISMVTTSNAGTKTSTLTGAGVGTLTFT